MTAARPAQRVDRALVELPALDAVLASGRLPWSKVGLLARCAETADEARWIALAERTDVRALERACRAIARGARASEELGVDEEGADTGPVEIVRLRIPVALAFAGRVTLRRLDEVVAEALALREAEPLTWASPWEVPERIAAGSGADFRAARQMCARPTDPARAGARDPTSEAGGRRTRRRASRRCTSTPARPGPQ